MLTESQKRTAEAPSSSEGREEGAHSAKAMLYDHTSCFRQPAGPSLAADLKEGASQIKTNQGNSTSCWVLEFSPLKSTELHQTTFHKRNNLH